MSPLVSHSPLSVSPTINSTMDEATFIRIGNFMLHRSSHGFCERDYRSLYGVGPLVCCRLWDHQQTSQQGNTMLDLEAAAPCILQRPAIMACIQEQGQGPSCSSGRWWGFQYFYDDNINTNDISFYAASQHSCFSTTQCGLLG